MSIILPDAATATTDSEASNTAAITAAQNEFIASTTVLINQAIENGLFMVQPYLPNLVTSDYVTTYFTTLGYSVLFPIVPSYPFNPAFVPGFPEVLPPVYIAPFFNFGANSGPPRIQINWQSS